MTTPTAPRRQIETLGPGSLVFGATGSVLDISCQVSNAVIEFDKDTEDDETMLCGDVIAGDRVYTAQLNFVAKQDYQLDGIIDWTWKHAGEQVPFEFIPRLTSSASVTGQVIVDPVNIGGDVKSRNNSEAEWNIVGMPAFTPQAATP